MNITLNTESLWPSILAEIINQIDEEDDDYNTERSEIRAKCWKSLVENAGEDYAKEAIRKK